MSCCSSAAAAAPTSFSMLLASSSSATGRTSNVLCSPPETQIGGLRFLGCGGGVFASPHRFFSPLVCIGRNPIRSVANSSTPFSESQDELEAIIEGQPQLPDQGKLRSVRIKIQMRNECQFGEQFFVVGAQPELGLWKPLDAIPMTWSDDDLWTAELDIPLGEPIQFKFILRQINGKFLWQPGEDRVFHTWETSNIISVFEDWEDPEAQQVTEESDALKTKTKQLEQSDEKYDEEYEIVAMDLMSSEGQISSTAEISGTEVADDNDVSHIVMDGVATSDLALIGSEDVLEKEEVPSLALGLNPCSTEDVTGKEEQVKVEPDISNIGRNIKSPNPQLDQKEEQVKRQSEQDEAKIGLTFTDEHAPTAVEHLKELSPNYDEDINGHPGQDLKCTFLESQSNKETDHWRDEIKWGQSTLKRFLNNLGFL